MIAFLKKLVGYDPQLLQVFARFFKLWFAVGLVVISGVAIILVLSWLG